jgi:quercetin dioxygenase-like cupin family protein
MRFSLPALLLAAIAASFAQTPIVNNYAPPNSPIILGSTFVDWDSLTAKINPNGISRAVFDNATPTLDKFEVHVTSLSPGMSSHPVHRHSWEEILLLKEGEVEVSINGKKQHAGPGAFIFFAANDPHNATNVGSKPATYYVVNFVTGLSHSADPNAPVKSAAEQAIPGKLPSSVIDCNSQPSTPTATGSRVVCVNSPTLTFAQLESHITTLNVGQSTAADLIDPGDEFVVVKSGSIEVKVNGIAARINEGSMIYWAPNDKRTIRNIGATPASYQVIRVLSGKSPKPTAN